LEKIFDNNGIEIKGESYSTESALILSLLNYFKKREYSDKIAAISGCAALIATLETAHADFETTRVTWEREKAIEGTLVNATQLKKVDFRYTDFCIRQAFRNINSEFRIYVSIS